MRKISFCFILVFLISTNLFSRVVSVTKEKGGSKGYDYVHESHSSTDDTHILTCRDPGEELCAWMVKNFFPITGAGTLSTDDLVEMADNEISIGHFEGKMIIGDEILLTWKKEGDKLVYTILSEEHFPSIYKTNN